MIVLGLSAFTHDTSAALFKNGELLCFIEEERLSRVKHTTAFPSLAIQECLRVTGVLSSEINLVVFSQVPHKEITENLEHILKYFPKSMNLLFQNEERSSNQGFFSKFRSIFEIKRTLKIALKLQILPPIKFAPHHLCHNASSFYASDFAESAVLSLDGRGEAVTTMMGKAGNSGLDVINEIKVPHSLGHLYAALTDYLGFRAFHDEWKVMGLSAYGQATLLPEFSSIVSTTPNGKFELDLSYFNFHTHGQKKWLADKFINTFGPKRLPNEPILQRHQDVAFALQRVVENTGVYLAQYLFSKADSENLCLSGGVALNCLMNSRILEKTNFKRIFVQPIANDAGASIGAGWLFEKPAVKKSNFSIYYGAKYRSDEMKDALIKYKLKFHEAVNVTLETAAILSKNLVVGWFQGASEMGPRALGNRSVLANPSDPHMKDKINRLIKKREFFRPFAPSVLEHRAEEFFRIPKNQTSPYMVLTADVVEEMKSRIPAVTHADGTARVQTVSRLQNEKYFELLSEFEKLTGVPVLLNTSFNENEPIVYTPEQAIDCFLRTELDALVLGDFIVLKSLQ